MVRLYSIVCIEVINVIVYAPLWETMKQRKVSTYYLINKCGISSSTIQNLRHNNGVSMATINDLCNILACDVSDILQHVPDAKPYHEPITPNK